jgi:hypothetical protein
MRNLIFAILTLFMFLSCNKQDDKFTFPISEEEKQAIQLLLGKWKYVYDYSQTFFERNIYYMDRPPLLTITEADILWQNEKKQDEYANAKFTFVGIDKVNPNRRENNRIDAYFYAPYKTKLDLRIPPSMSIYLSQPDTLRVMSIADHYILFVKEK